jgi:succinyl-diaminopimelate desuccinylase
MGRSALVKPFTNYCDRKLFLSREFLHKISLKTQFLRPCILPPRLLKFAIMSAPMVDAAEIRDIFFSLLRVNTANPPGNEAELALRIRNYLLGQGARAEDLRFVDHGGGRGSLVYRLGGRNPAFSVGFAGHLDTVPAGKLADWSSDPFEPLERDGLVYARGAADMKGGIAAMLALCVSWLRKGPPPVDLVCLFTADEESAGAGMKALCDAGLLENLSFLIVAEPTGLRPALSEKGLAWYDVTALGKTSHASMPGKGANALELGYAWLNRIKRRVVSAAGADPLLGKNTFSITQAQGGVKINVIPDQAVFALDIRLLPGKAPDWEGVETLFREEADRLGAAHPGFSAAWERRDCRAALQSDPRHPAVRRFLELSGNGKPIGVHYFTDASLVIPRYPKLPFVIFGPGDPGECHCPDEKIPLASIGEAAAQYYYFVDQLRTEWFS